MLAEHLPGSLSDPALHLAFDDLVVDDIAGVVDRGEAHDLGDAGLGLDLDFGDVAAVREGHAELALGFHVERIRRARVFFREREERDRAVGAFDAIGPVGELDVGGGGFEILRGERKALLYDLLRGELHHAPHAQQRARAAGRVADQAHGGIAVPQAEVLHRHPEDGGDDLRVARLVALPVRVRDRVHRDPAAGVEAQLDLVGRREASAACFDIGGHAAPAQFSARFGLAAPRGKSRPIRSLHRVGEHALEIAAVVGDAVRRLVGKLVLGHEIPAPQLGGIHFQFERRLIDQPLDHVGHHRAARSAVSGPGRLVRHREPHARARGRNVVHAGEAGDHALRVDEGTGRGEIGAEVGDVREAHGEKFPRGVERELARAGDVAPLLVRQEDLGAASGPLHRSADFFRGEQHGAVFRIHVEAHPEPAADVLGDHVDLVVGNAHRVDELAAHPGRALSAGIERVFSGGGVVGSGAGARLHRVADHARVVQRELHHARGRAERGLGRGLVARDPVEGKVPGKLGVELCRAGFERLFRGGHRGQLVIFDRDQLGGVLRELRRLRHDAGDALADVADFSLREHRARRFFQRLAEPILDAEVGRNRLVAGFGHVLAGEHDEHSRGFERSGRVDGNDLGVRAVRAQERRVGLIRKIPVGGETPLPGEQAPVFQSSFHID